MVNNRNKIKSKMQMEKEAYHSIGFVDGIDTASAIFAY